MKRFQLAKAVSLGAVLMVLMVGLSMIGGLAGERMGYRAQAAASVRESLAGPQTILRCGDANMFAPKRWNDPLTETRRQ